MTSENVVTLTGNLTRDPELRFTPGGQPVASFGMAVNRRWMNRQTNEWNEEVAFFDIDCWGSLAENISSTVGKGSRVVVVGRLDFQTWETDGEKRSKVKITADEVAVSLRWATAVVTKVQGQGQSQGAPQGNGGGYPSGGGGYAPSPAARPQVSTASRPPIQPPSLEEEPF